AAGAVDRLGDPVRREDRQAVLPRRHEHHHQVGGAALRGVRERRLVAVMAVCDQQLRSRQVRKALGPPELVAGTLEIWLAVGKLHGIALVEEKDWLEL